MRNSLIIAILFSGLLLAQPSFSAADLSTNVAAASSVYAEDMDGDGDIDILTTSESGDKIYWLENDGASNPSFSLETVAHTIDGAWAIFPIDLGQDGDMDIVSASINNDAIAWYENDGAADPSWSAANIATSFGAFFLISYYLAFSCSCNDISNPPTITLI